MYYCSIVHKPHYSHTLHCSIHHHIEDQYNATADHNKTSTLQYLVGALHREVSDKYDGQTDGAHDRPDQLLPIVELTAQK